MKSVELLWSADCPNHPIARRLLGEVIAQIAPGTPILRLNSVDGDTAGLGRST